MKVIREGEIANKAPQLTYPALYSCADEASNGWQWWYLAAIKAEYGLLALAAVLSLNIFDAPAYHSGYALVFVLSLAVLLYRTNAKPEQAWYRCRAMAESVKTSTWAYMMHAKPFDGTDADSGAQLRTRVADLMKSNEHIADKLQSAPVGQVQTTREMDLVRALPWRQRRDYYVENRISDQRNWYTNKASQNDALATRWQVASVAVYLIAVTMAISRPTYASFVPVWPIEPLIVVAASILGWVQIKKFNELASVYRLTALEIGLIEDKLKRVENEVELGEFVNEAELAFSREHTQWVARQTNRY